MNLYYGAKWTLMFPSASPWHILGNWTLTPPPGPHPLAGAFYFWRANPFLRSAHRFFIVIDNRFRVAADIPWRFRGDEAPLPEVSVVVTAAPVSFAPSSAAIWLAKRSYA
jgi:hypothetical protein